MMNAICVVCGAQSIRTLNVRPKLSYDVCQKCGHCELISCFKSIEKSFKFAQEKYFGESSLLTRELTSSLNDEIVSVRRNIVGSVLSRTCDVLEVGPGSGAFLNWLSQRGHRVIAVEHSKALACILSKRLDAKIFLGEFENIDIDKESIDLFCAFHVIEHVRDPVEFLRKAIGVVRAGGYGFVATPNSESWEQRAFPFVSPNFDSAHLRVFSQASLRRLCEKAGWSVVRVITPEYTMSWIRILTKALRRVKGEDEEETAGKYAGTNAELISRIGSVARVVTYPFRAIQEISKGGNELFFILKKPE